ncbi:Resolvase, N terminal domain [Actinopolyspora lacussalsi subsp. righensis]|uniref:Resolvase, N terminal domain n=1 Tax=Actinopolyspora righensis TaxID=995060 RepID=A0A1I7C3D1_9ACTN|nr:recombinase family protein [Actinopolyspora righensis]SFT93888.1 Resolvase, N terminal domain [Actinopolyspora righensis]
MSETITGYARCSTDEQDLAAQRQRLGELGIADERIYLDHGLTGTTRARPGLDQALAAVREGDALVVPKLDRHTPDHVVLRNLAQSLSTWKSRDLRLSEDELVERCVRMFVAVGDTFRDAGSGAIRCPSSTSSSREARRTFLTPTVPGHNVRSLLSER